MDTPKVPKPQFDAVLRSLLNAAPMPMAGILRKREAKQLAQKRLLEKRKIGGKKQNPR